MAKRQLTDIERKLNEKGIARLQEEVEYYKFLEDQTKLLLDRGLDLSHKRKKKKVRAELKEIQREIDENQKMILDMYEQLKHGVEKKEKKEAK